MVPHKVIIDTDPGVDDILALLLAFSASAEELEVLQISVTFGNVEVERCLRNAVSLFHILELERRFRKENNLKLGFESLAKFKPILTVGAEAPLEGVENQYDYFHGTDGLAGAHTSAPHFTPTEMWTHLFTESTADGDLPMKALPPNFVPSAMPSHKEMLRLLRENEPDTITIIALGPLTNIALAADEDPETFLRVKEVVPMGGSISAKGNVTPTAEFNSFADPFAAARIYALTSPKPSSTMPLARNMLPYPEPLSRPLNLTLFPLDITLQHLMSVDDFKNITDPLVAKGSPLAQWAQVFFIATVAHMETLYTEGTDLRMQLHDPSCVWYVLTKHMEGWRFIENRDIRVEATGQWTRGMSVVDERSHLKEESLEQPVKKHDRGVWLHMGYGNRVRQAVECPTKETMGKEVLSRIFGC